MPHEDPVISPDEPTIGDVPARQTAVQPHQPDTYEPIDEPDEWLEEPVELPRRPRRRLLSPVPIALLGVLLTACGFIGGVLVEKGQTSSGSPTGSAASLASRFARLRSAASGAAGGLGGGGFGAGAGAGATVGSVAYISAGTLYVITAEGNTVKVTTSAATTVTKTVTADVKGIHPGETVTVTGASGANGAVSAETIRVGAGGAGGGLGALFSGSGSSGSSGASSGGGPALFGNGG
jgi:hypothetical protein